MSVSSRIEEFYCSESNLLLANNDVVTLIPCAHKAIKTVAERRFGKGDRLGVGKQDKECSRCQKAIKGYIDDKQSQDLINNFVNLVNDKEVFPQKINWKNSHLKAGVSYKDAVTTVKSESSQKQELSYPGESAIFSHFKGDWKDLGGKDIGPNKTIIFFTESQTSYISGIKLLGYKDGKIELYLEIQLANLEEFQVYLSSIKISLKNTDCNYKFLLDDNFQIKQMLEIICENNLFKKGKEIIDQIILELEKNI